MMEAFGLLVELYYHEEVGNESYICFQPFMSP